LFFVQENICGCKKILEIVSSKSGIFDLSPVKKQIQDAEVSP